MEFMDYNTFYDTARSLGFLSSHNLPLQSEMHCSNGRGLRSYVENIIIYVIDHTHQRINHQLATYLMGLYVENRNKVQEKVIAISSFILKETIKTIQESFNTFNSLLI